MKYQKNMEWREYGCTPKINFGIFDCLKKYYQFFFNLEDSCEHLGIAD